MQLGTQPELLRRISGEGERQGEATDLTDGKKTQRVPQQKHTNSFQLSLAAHVLLQHFQFLVIDALKDEQLQ